MHILAETYNRLFGVDLLKEDDSFTTDKYDVDPNIVELRRYKVVDHTETYADEIIETYDYEEAKLEYDEWSIKDVEDYKFSERDHVIELTVFISYYKFILDEEDEIPEDYPIEDFYDDEDVYEFVDDGYYKTLAERDVQGINRNVDELISELMRHFHYKYGSYAIKYSDIPVETDDGDYVGYIKLRISSHSPNLSNVTRFGTPLAHLAVTVADRDPTRSKFIAADGGYYRDVYVAEMLYNGEDLQYKDEVISEIEDRIEDMKDMFIGKFKNGEIGGE